MAYILLFIGTALLLSLAGLYAWSGVFDIAIAYGLAGAALLFFSCIYLFAIKPANERLSRDRLLEWLERNKDQVLSVGSSYKGDAIDADSILVKYCIVYSAGAFTRKTFSNYCIIGTSRSAFVGLISTSFNLIFGWWSIPWGLIYTPQSLLINLRQTESVRVADIVWDNLEWHKD